ncbi:MAG: hypothetical protein ACOCV1_04385 [Bacillota bacterium]
MNELDNVYREYHNLTNMSYSELLKWSKNPCSFKASLDRRPIERNLMLLKTPKSQWTQHHINEAKKMISFERRHSKAPAGKEVPGCGISKRTIARKNWAVDPNKR